MEFRIGSIYRRINGPQNYKNHFSCEEFVDSKGNKSLYLIEQRKGVHEVFDTKVQNINDYEEVLDKGLITRKTIQLDNGCRIDVCSQEYKTMSVFTYWGYTSTGHLVGYSKDYKSIVKRIEKKLKG